MTKEEIIVALKSRAKPYEDYSIDDDIKQAMFNLANPYVLVEPILELIATNPTVDFGNPGELVHFVEQFYKKGYEDLLIASVLKQPSPHNIWMLHRCFNAPNDSRHQVYQEVIETIRADALVSDEIKQTIDAFDW